MINRYKNNTDPHYCVRITSDEGDIGKQLLERFRDNDKDIPVICTSSQMLTTGVDARNVRNIVLVRNIQSMVEFKQIIGRGTRLFEGKDYFTVIDFTGASNLFYDPAWDGEPVLEVPIETEAIDSTNETGKVREPKPESQPTELKEETRPTKVEVELSNGRKLKVTNVEVRYIDADGKPLTAKEFLEKLIGFIPNLYSTEEEFRRLWANPDTREQILKQLEQEGFDSEQLDTLREMLSAKDCDIFDVISYLTYSSEMLTRHQRVEIAETDHFFDVFQNMKAREFLHFVLKRYEKDDIQELRRDRIGELIKLNNLGTPMEAAQVFGGSDQLIDAFYKLQTTLYKKLG